MVVLKSIGSLLFILFNYLVKSSLVLGGILLEEFYFIVRSRVGELK